MECKACGYTYLQKWQIEDLETMGRQMPEKLGEKEFLLSDNKFKFIDHSNAGYGGYGWSDGSFESYLYACPECGTIKIEKW